MRGMALALAVVLSTVVCGAAQAQDPIALGPDRTVSFRSISLDGDVTLRLTGAGERTVSDERPTAVMFLPPAEARALIDGLDRCGTDREVCGLAVPAYRVTVLAVDPTEIARLAGRRPDPATATSAFLARELPEWLFEQIAPDDTLLIAGGAESVDALRGALLQPGAYDEMLLLEPGLEPEVARALMSAVPPFGGETGNIDIYADPWSPGEDLATETLVNAMVEGPYYVNWIAPDDQAPDPDAARRAVAVGIVWRMAAVPPW
ncbi:hypothetical protein [Brevundimonas sp.]|uniref:hypothetical protein n=1 Tax=Brevundimonas sp. TaxID=1871086 RepID=UPI002617E84F|nr:hypothetical protein [Brevundimonas sp.]